MVTNTRDIPEAARFDFRRLKNTSVAVKLDVGASSYWSEIAAMQTLDNLMVRGALDIVDYLERIPDGYIAKKQELLDKLKGVQGVDAIDDGRRAGVVAPYGALPPPLPAPVSAAGNLDAVMRAVLAAGAPEGTPVVEDAEKQS